MKPPPQGARHSGRVEVTHASANTYTIAVRGHEMKADQPRDANGDDLGPTPVELFIASLAACVAHYTGGFLRRYHLPRENLRVTAGFDMAEDGPPRVIAVRLRILLPVELSSAQREVLHAVVSRCTVHNSLRTPPEVSIHVG
ncbi:hypothetical protein ADK38_32420 [Streptomyces varsoviensis]|uniref:Osmotically inducible protein OsmC n=1 Tax=Streptomyces varsoviensis TaxID=67373 RepID=A0ABR5IYH9_9ACTN|nr:hypothetical protein ADK38_32420 [Streptomyces varsoviensis]